MNSKILKPNNIVVAFAILFISIIRVLFPGVEKTLGGFTPVFAVAIFGSAVLANRWLAAFVPLAIMFLSDITINALYYDYGLFYSGMAQVYVIYLAMIISSIFIMSKITLTRVVTASFVMVLIHWVATSIAYAYGADAHNVITKEPIGPNLQGFIISHTQAIPHELRLLAGTLIYSAVLFGIYYFSTKANMKPATAKA